jgi:Fur family transcriptional regulator, ferric uptake regulator
MTVAPERRPLVFERVEHVTDALRRAGHRVTAPARLVIDALFAADGPVSAEQIAGGLDGRRSALELTSVYRNLERLEQIGAVSHVHAGHGPGLYALARTRDREYLVCDRCGRVTSVDPEALDPLRDALRDALGHHARFSHFPIHGLCAGCEQAPDPSIPRADHAARALRAGGAHTGA